METREAPEAIEPTMPFQFLCPRGHLLQGDESQSGQHCKCPYCDATFLVPQPSGDPRPDHLPVARAQPQAGRLAAEDRPVPATPEPPGETLPQIRTGVRREGDPTEVAAQLGFGGGSQQDLLHIPCPKGHVLETPREMLGQDAMCPHCRAQFRLRLRDSLEQQCQREEQRQRREQKLGKVWLHRAVATAVVVVLAVIALVVLAVYR